MDSIKDVKKALEENKQKTWKQRRLWKLLSEFESIARFAYQQLTSLTQKRLSKVFTNEPCFSFSSARAVHGKLTHTCIISLLPGNATMISLVLFCTKILNNFLQYSSINCFVVLKMYFIDICYKIKNKERTGADNWKREAVSLRSSGDLPDLGETEIPGWIVTTQLISLNLLSTDCSIPPRSLFWLPERKKYDCFW